ncbi:MAG: NAD(P)H:quinone oxidoreductase [Gammaproteobacteria bacterium]|nr:NAD(P)H:quinone oxidoreductase [Gammaproteobacteria bacterium]
MPPYVLILYYSRYGATRQMAEYVARGVERVTGVEAMLRTVPEVTQTIQESAPKVPDQGAPYVTLDELKNCAGLALGSPTRFGNMSAAMKYFWDSTSKLWMSGDLINKPAGVFTSTSSLHGGQEMTLFSMMIPLLHHGMVICGVPYSEAALVKTKSGGTPYGPSHHAGEKSDNPVSEEEKATCLTLGERLAHLALKLKQ